MGIVITYNMLVSRAAQQFIGTSFADPTPRLLLSLGGLGGWFCILPAAYFAGSADGHGFLQGLLFVLASLGGAIVAGLFRIPGLTQLVAILALPINVGFAVLVYYLTRH